MATHPPPQCFRDQDDNHENPIFVLTRGSDLVKEIRSWDEVSPSDVETLLYSCASQRGRFMMLMTMMDHSNSGNERAKRVLLRLLDRAVASFDRSGPWIAKFARRIMSDGAYHRSVALESHLPDLTRWVQRVAGYLELRDRSRARVILRRCVLAAIDEGVSSPLFVEFGRELGAHGMTFDVSWDNILSAQDRIHPAVLLCEYLDEVALATRFQLNRGDCEGAVETVVRNRGNRELLVHALASAERLAEAVEYVPRTPRLTSMWWATGGLVLESHGRYTDAEAFYRRATKYSGDKMRLAGSVSWTLARAGKEADAERLMRSLIA